MDVQRDERFGFYRRYGGNSTRSERARMDRGGMASQSPAQAIDGNAGFGTVVRGQPKAGQMPTQLLLSSGEQPGFLGIKFRH